MPTLPQLITLIGIFGSLLSSQTASSVLPPQINDEQGSPTPPAASNVFVAYASDDPLPAQPSVPQKIRIPAINLEAVIDQVGLTPDSIVDTPINEVGWYKDGPKPGEIGNATLNGHFKNSSFGPGVFYNLSLLAAGDIISVIDDLGQEFQFRVIKKDIVSVADFPLTEVYGSSTVSRLILITCAGAYSNTREDFSHRTIIYSELLLN